jgi:hypothetical protein
VQDLIRKGYEQRNQYNTSLLQRDADGTVRLAPCRQDGIRMVNKVDRFSLSLSLYPPPPLSLSLYARAQICERADSLSLSLSLSLNLSLSRVLSLSRMLQVCMHVPLEICL